MAAWGSEAVNTVKWGYSDTVVITMAVNHASVIHDFG